MAKASDNIFPKIILGVLSTDPSAPTDGSWKLYSKVDGIYARSSNSIVGAFGSSGGGGSTLTGTSYKRTAGNYTTTSGSFVDIDGTNFALTITTGAHRVLVALVGAAEATVAGDAAAFDVLVDGVSVSSGQGVTATRFDNIASYRKNVSFTYMTDALSAGSHTFKLQWKQIVGSGGLTLFGGTSSGIIAQMWVAEQAF